MNETIQFANDRPTSCDDELYQWAVISEDIIRKQSAQIDDMRSLLMRWLNDALSTNDVKTLELKTLEILKC